MAVHLLLYRGPRLLLLRRANSGYRDGWLSVPAGHLDGGEELRAAAARELWEETGVRVDPGQLEPVHVMHRLEGRESIDFFLAVRDWAGEPVNREPHKCTELMWCAPPDLPPDVVPYVRRAIESAREGQAFDSYGW